MKAPKEQVASAVVSLYECAYHMMYINDMLSAKFSAPGKFREDERRERRRS